MLVAFIVASPQAMIWSNQYRTSSVTLSEKPCEVTLLRIWMPMEPILVVAEG